MKDWQTLIKKYWVGGLLAVAASLILAVCLLRNRQPVNTSLEISEPALFSSESSTESQEVIAIYVDIKGAVAAPGMYQVAADCRLIEGVEIAGGFTEEADQEQLNFALRLTDQQVVYVPKVGETVPESFAEAALPGEAAAGKVNINTARAEELQTLAGIGPKKAQEIVAYREANGSFKDIFELTEVSGIGEKTVEKIKDSITI